MHSVICPRPAAASQKPAHFLYEFRALFAPPVCPINSLASSDDFIHFERLRKDILYFFCKVVHIIWLKEDDSLRTEIILNSSCTGNDDAVSLGTKYSKIRVGMFFSVKTL